MSVLLSFAVIDWIDDKEGSTPGPEGSLYLHLTENLNLLDADAFCFFCVTVFRLFQFLILFFKYFSSAELTGNIEVVTPVIEELGKFEG